VDEALAKIADNAQGRVKLQELTTGDRLNLLDSFVNSEKTLKRIFE
jgi:hypothetical protein